VIDPCGDVYLGQAVAIAIEGRYAPADHEFAFPLGFLDEVRDCRHGRLGAGGR
jgi:hypothetical protein